MNTGVWQRMAAELDKLLDCDLPQREQHLSELQKEDPDLASCLRVALDADTRELALLDSPLSLRLELPDDSAGSALPVASPGDHLGPWRLERELGHGGMGQVWLARRADGEYEIEVAIKLVDGFLDSDLLRGQLRRERQILADLDHPNIARLLDGGIRDNGTPWYAMEYVCGLPLDQYCQQHGLSLSARLRLLVIVAEAVQHAHSHLVVHRDLKPGNILVDDAGTPHLLDFGIAKLLDAGSAAQSGPLTLMAAATPAYAAPEQLRGEQVGTAADVYALGVIAFELIAGTRPPPDWQSDDCSRGPRPSRFAQDRRQRAIVRGDADAIVAQALAPDATDRYASAKAFGDDISRYLHGLPVEARAAGTAYRARKFIGRHWLGVSLGSGAIVLLLVALAFSVVQTRRAQAELVRANAVQGFLLGVFDAAQPAPGGSFVVTQRELADRAVGLLEQQLAAQPDAAVDVLIAVGRVYRKLGFADRSRQILERALRDLDSMPGTSHDPRRVMVLLALGRADYLAGDFIAASRHLDMANSLADSSTPVAARAAILYELGSSQSTLRHITKALSTLDRAEVMAHSAPAATPLLPKILLEKALAWRRNQNIEKAIAGGLRALASARTVYGDRDVRTASALSTVGAMMRRGGRLAEAERMLRQAVSIEQSAYGQPQSATVNNLATVLQNRGELVEAVALFRQALALASQHYGAEAVTTASYRRNLALVQADAGQLDAALTNMRKAYARYRDGYPSGSPGNLEMRAQLASVLYQAARPDEARSLLLEIMADAPRHARAAIVPLCHARMLSARLALDAGHVSAAQEQLDAARRLIDPQSLESTDQVRLQLLAGDIAQAARQPDRAGREWRAALHMARQSLGPKHGLARAAAERLHTAIRM